MDFLQKCDASNRLSSNRNTSQNSFRPVSQADRTNSSLIEPDGTKVKRLTFAEDFMLEHSHSGQHIDLTAILASAGTIPREPKQSAQSFGFPS
jgi:hypothetical protein